MRSGYRLSRQRAPTSISWAKRGFPSGRYRCRALRHAVLGQPRPCIGELGLVARAMLGVGISGLLHEAAGARALGRVGPQGAGEQEAGSSTRRSAAGTFVPTGAGRTAPLLIDTINAIIDVPS